MVRVRFAPSPTGYLHIGGARTALFNWLYARHTGGKFILRIEDTDTARNTQEAVDVIFRGLRWLGLDWDEGPETSDPTGPSRGAHGPYFQSQRREIYDRYVERLLASGAAYRDDGAVRFRMERAPIIVPDLVAGDVRRELTDRELADPDFVIVRSDGQPVFHLVNVIDDLEMGITHVIRGEDHLSNTPKHIALFRALGAAPPNYAHIPLILNPNGSKMSKRDTGASLTAYLDELFLPEALVNYLYLLGWSPKGNREIVPLPEVIQLFDLPQILRHNARFDMARLEAINSDYQRRLDDTRNRELGRAALVRAGVDLSAWPEDYVHAALDTCKGKLKKFSELGGYAGFYFTDTLEFDAPSVAQLFIPDNQPRLEHLRRAFAASPTWDAAALEAALKAVAAELALKVGVLVHPLRLACTGRSAGPSLYHLMEILGRERTLARIDAAAARCGTAG